MEEEGKLNPEPQQIKRVINLSHIRSGVQVPVEKYKIKI
jgi:hypothetical protein